MKENEGGRQAPRMPAYGAEYLLFGALLAYGNRLQTLGDGFYTEVTTKQWFLLACLELFETPPTLGEVAGAMGCSHQNVKQLALKLAQKGYVLFRRDAADARRTRVLPGPACAALRDNYLQKQQAFILALFAGVPLKDIKAALDVIAKLDENMRIMQEGEI